MDKRAIFFFFFLRRQLKRPMLLLKPIKIAWEGKSRSLEAAAMVQRKTD
jgi:hypothetical protein